MKYCFGISNITTCNKKCFLLVNCQTINVKSCFTVPGRAFLISFLITISKPWILNAISVEGLETINKLCTLYLPFKPDTSLSSVPMVKSHKNKCPNYFREATPLLITVW